MDPDEALKRLREFIETARQSGPNLTNARPSQVVKEAWRVISHTEEIMAQFTSLDEWITRGGFLPQDWQPVRTVGRPRKEPGDTLEGVEHGTRAGYQAGCRCEECRAANARAAREWRDARRMKEEVEEA